MRLNPWLSGAALCSALVGALHAQSASPVTIKDAWVRATVPQQHSTGAFMRLTAPVNLRLVQVQSSLAEALEIHEMAMAGEIMQMRAVEALELPAGKAVDLRPGGYHIMLMGLKQQVKVGDTVPLTLVFEGADKKRQIQNVRVTVRPLGSQTAKP
jgi:periplasmic copper chaperone A